MKSRIVLLGPPASGKGTQAALLSATFGIPAASTGAMFREERARGSQLGVEAEHWTVGGKLFPDELALRVVWKWLDNRGRFILDGFPRTLGQAESFDQGLQERDLPLDVVYFLELSDELVRERMTSRLTCKSCSSVFNQKFHNVTAGSTCPKCGGELVRRNDDTDDALDCRLAQFREHTLPVAHHYRDKGLLKEVNVKPGRDAVFSRLYYDVREEVPNDPN
jgi:adenylate kinase